MHEGGGRWVGSNKLVELKKKKKGYALDFTGGTVDRNLLASAGDMGSNPDLERSYMPWSN